MLRHRFTLFIEWIIGAIAVLFLGALTILMFCERTTMDFAEFKERFTPAQRSFLHSFLLSLCAWLFLAAICYMAACLLRGRITWKATTIIASILAAAVCLLWNAIYPYGPISDQGRTWKAASQLAQASGAPVTLEEPIYFAAYPQQKCMAVVMAPIARIVGGLVGNDRGYSFRIVNSIAVALIVAELCVLSHQIYDRERTVTITAALAVAFVPNILYSSYVYGTQIALVCSLAGFICCLQYCRTNRLRWLLPIAIVMPIGVLFYISSLIALMAMIIVILLHVLRQDRLGRHQIATVGLAAVIVIMVLAARGLAICHFDRMTDVPDAQGISAISYLAMGISSDNKRGPGSYDASGWENYTTLGGEAERAIARENLSTYLAEYLHGERPLGFFVQKTVCQWCDPWFGSAVMTIYLGSDEFSVTEGFQSVVQGIWAQRLEKLLTIYVSTCYLAAFVAMIHWLRKRTNRDTLLLILYFIGGFLFQLAWETKSRYCYPYFVILLPLFAYAITLLGNRVGGLLEGIKRRR